MYHSFLLQALAFRGEEVKPPRRSKKIELNILIILNIILETFRINKEKEMILFEFTRYVI